MFKEGDTIRCIDTSGIITPTRFTRDKGYIVRELIQRSRSDPFFIMVESDDLGYASVWRASRFELAFREVKYDPTQMGDTDDDI